MQEYVPNFLENLTDDELKKEAKNEAKNDALSSIIKVCVCMWSVAVSQFIGQLCVFSSYLLHSINVPCFCLGFEKFGCQVALKRRHCKTVRNFPAQNDPKVCEKCFLYMYIPLELRM